MKKLFIILLVAFLFGCASFMPATTTIKETALTRQQSFEAALNSVIKNNGNITYSDEKKGIISANAGDCIKINVSFIDISPTFSVSMPFDCFGFTFSLSRIKAGLLKQYEIEKKRLIQNGGLK